MKKYVILLVIFGASILSLQAQKKPKSPKGAEASVVSTSLNFYKKLEGTIISPSQKDTMRIEMHLTKLDSVIKGVCYFKNRLMPEEFAGNIARSGEIMIEEFESFETNESRYPIKAVLRGMITPTNEFKGTWERLESDSVHTVLLKETYADGSGEYDFVKNAKGYGLCTYGNCADFILVYPILKKLPTAAKINQEITKEILGQYAKEEKKDAFRDFNEPMNLFFSRYKEEEKSFAQAGSKEKPIWDNHKQAEIYYNGNNMTTLKFTSELYEGGERPSTNVHYQVIDLNTGRELTLQDMFVEGYEDKLNKIGELTFRRNYGYSDIQDLRSEGFTFENGKFKLNNNFAIGKKGIIFQFNPYEIGAYMLGSPQIFIPYRQIRNLIKADSPLRAFQRDE